MSALSDLLTVADTYCTATGRSRSTVATLVFNHRSKLDLIAAGRDLNTRSFERAMAWFSANWPADLGWPDEIARPAPIVPPLAPASVPRAAHEADPRCEA